MPIYEYKCQECGKKSEYRVSFHEEQNPVTCKSCGSRKVQKLISVPVISSGKELPSGQQTCCGRNERCADGGHCCGH